MCERWGFARVRRGIEQDAGNHPPLIGGGDRRVTAIAGGHAEQIVIRNQRQLKPIGQPFHEERRTQMCHGNTAATRKHIIATASQMFLTRGLVATNIADIMSAAGLTQGGFYRHFESKEQLIAEANQVAFDQLMDMFDKTAEGIPPGDAIATIVRLYLRQLRSNEPSHMCPLANLCSELGVQTIR